MVRIKATKADVIWGYCGTILSMASGFILLPMLLFFLSGEELGLWYVFVAISNLTLLFEFGFNPAFSRNIVYCLSGARSIAKLGVSESPVRDDVDWSLLKSIMDASRLLYAILAFVALLVTATIGTLYVWTITQDMVGTSHWIAWGVFCLAIFFNLYYYYFLTFLRGYGDVAGENKAKTVARIIQLAVSAALLFAGFGLVGAALGYLSFGLALRFCSRCFIKRHVDIESELKKLPRRMDLSQVKQVLLSVSYVAWRDGVVQICCFASTQAMSIICSLFLGLEATGQYSILLQLSTAVYNLSSVFIRSFYPSFQSSYVSGDVPACRAIVGKGIVVYALLFIAGTVLALLIAFPLVPFFKPGVTLDAPTYIFLSVYLFLWNQHSIFCNLIVSMNRIPHMVPYLVAAVMGAALSAVFTSCFEWGLFGLIGGQMLSQVVYNNWKWPLYVARELKCSYISFFSEGFRWLLGRLKWLRA